ARAIDARDTARTPAVDGDVAATLPIEPRQPLVPIIGMSSLCLAFREFPKRSQVTPLTSRHSQTGQASARVQTVWHPGNHGAVLDSLAGERCSRVYRTLVNGGPRVSIRNSPCHRDLGRGREGGAVATIGSPAPLLARGLGRPFMSLRAVP